MALAPWSCGRRRTWPKRHWRELAELLIADGLTPLVLHAFDAPVADVAGIRLTGLPLPQVAALLSMAKVAVVNDSGLLHLAAAVGCSTLSLWGSTNPAVTLEGYPRAEFIFHPDAPTRPAGCRAPCYSLRGSCDFAACRNRCRLLDAITPTEVRDALRSAAPTGDDAAQSRISFRH